MVDEKERIEEKFCSRCRSLLAHIGEDFISGLKLAETGGGNWNF
jgi:hypothetical protein